MRRRRSREEKTDEYKKGYHAGWKRVIRKSTKNDYGGHTKDWIRGLHDGRRAAKRFIKRKRGHKIV